jgi:cardiolipin synthase A/B
MFSIYPILIAIYLLGMVYTVVLILLHTQSTAKALGYLLLVLAVPVVGIAIYYAFGLNLRHHGSTARMMLAQEKLDEEMLVNKRPQLSFANGGSQYIPEHFRSVVSFLNGLSNEPLLDAHFSLLTNGEEKFPDVLNVLAKAKQFIHMEYYAWENDVRGNEIKDILLVKVKQGVKVRVMYDDYASRMIKRNIVKELKAGGVDVYPRIKVRFPRFANKMNHRDHRKIIIVDGFSAYVGGINVSDRYDNSIVSELYWRDTHVKIVGPLVNSMQRHFVVCWNTCQPEQLSYTRDLFPECNGNHASGTKAIGQMVAGGPIYPLSNIMLTYDKVFSLAREKIYITNPYFIPSGSILDTLKQSALSGVDVRIIMPFKSDSAVVGAAAKFYYPGLIKAGVRIYFYKKGFVHAKTVVADSSVSIIGTANLDVRSFDLNFEIMSVIYGREFSKHLEDVFFKDLAECVELTQEMVDSTSFGKRLAYSSARLVSSFL